MALQPSHYSAPKRFHHTELKHSTRSTVTPLVAPILLSDSMNLLILQVDSILVFLCLAYFT